MVVLHSRKVVVNPRGRQGHARILDERVIAAKVHADEDRSSLFASVRDDEEQMYPRTVGRAKDDQHLFLCGLAAEETAIFTLDPSRYLPGSGRLRAVHVVLEQRLQFRPALAQPLFPARDPPAVE